MKSDKRLSGRLENGSKSPKIADLDDLLLFTPTCCFAKRGVEKRGDYKVTTWLGPKHLCG